MGMQDGNSSIHWVDLGKYKLEPHVAGAITISFNSSEVKFHNAGSLLLAAAELSTASRSRAFIRIAELLKISAPDVAVPPVSALPKEFGMTPGLHRSWKVAESYFSKNGNEIWGRDFLTWIIFSDDDPSLAAVVEPTGKSVEELRFAWYEFVATDLEFISRRPPQFWIQWWHEAEETWSQERGGHRVEILPYIETKPEPEPFEEENVVEEMKTLRHHNTLLLAWDSENEPGPDIVEIRNQLAAQGEAIARWDVDLKGIADVGARVYFLRRWEPAGFLGWGLLEESVVPDPPDALEAPHVIVRWTHFRHEPPLLLSDLIQQTGDDVFWKSASNGVDIPYDIAERLGRAWATAMAANEDDLYSSPGVVSKRPSPIAALDRDSIPVIGDLTNYRPSERDSLDANSQAEIFASLLTAQSTQPPLALGLLGDWGVGKTFFMRLMQESVQKIAGRGVKRQTDSDAVKRVAQIEFNAWHYVDSDLWASLASHLFDKLSEELKGIDDSLEKVRRTLRLKIQSSQREHNEAIEAIETAKNERTKAISNLERQEAERARVAARRESFRLKRVWQAVLSVKPDPDKPDQADWPDVAKLKIEIEGAASRFGITEVIGNVEELQRVTQSMTDLSRRGKGLAAGFAMRFQGWNAVRSVGWLVLLVGLVLAWPSLLSWFADKIDWLGNTSKDIVALVLEVSSILGIAGNWIGRNVRALSRGLDYAEALQREIDRPRVDLAKPSAEELKLKKEVDCLDTSIAAEQLRLTEAERQISEAQAEIQRINSGGLVYDFLNDRRQDSRYIERLGLISVIRHDFEELRKLLIDWRQHWEEITGETAPEEPPIERIILYIDDLDRCPPQRVVEVLQAVHLLLAFDLFVVVVAVDARWLERSLNEQYNPQRAGTGNTVNNEVPHRFDAHNYLEKIFQIPFSLPVMDEDGYGRLVAGIVASPKTRAARKKADQEGNRPSPIERLTSHGVDEVDADLSHGESAGVRTKQIDESAPFDEPGDDIGKEFHSDPSPEKLAEQQRIEQAAAERVQAMMLEDYEEEFIQALFPFIPTPRIAKRFINIYRLIRVRAAMRDQNESKSSATPMSEFLDPENGDYRAVLLLLAISVGHPEAAPELLVKMQASSENSFRGWIGQIVWDYQKISTEIADHRRQRATRNMGLIEPEENEMLLRKLQHSVREIERRFQRVEQRLRDQGRPSIADDISLYQKWAFEVGRFSFRWHLRSEN